MLDKKRINRLCIIALFALIIGFKANFAYARYNYQKDTDNSTVLPDISEMVSTDGLQINNNNGEINKSKFYFLENDIYINQDVSINKENGEIFNCDFLVLPDVEINKKYGYCIVESAPIETGPSYSLWYYKKATFYAVKVETNEQGTTMTCSNRDISWTTAVSSKDSFIYDFYFYSFVEPNSKFAFIPFYSKNRYYNRLIPDPLYLSSSEKIYLGADQSIYNRKFNNESIMTGTFDNTPHPTRIFTGKIDGVDDEFYTFFHFPDYPTNYKQFYFASKEFLTDFEKPTYLSFGANCLDGLGTLYSVAQGSDLGSSNDQPLVINNNFITYGKANRYPFFNILKDENDIQIADIITEFFYNELNTDEKITIGSSKVIPKACFQKIYLDSKYADMPLSINGISGQLGFARHVQSQEFNTMGVMFYAYCAESLAPWLSDLPLNGENWASFNFYNSGEFISDKIDRDFSLTCSDVNQDIRVFLIDDWCALNGGYNGFNGEIRSQYKFTLKNVNLGSLVVDYGEKYPNSDLMSPTDMSCPYGNDLICHVWDLTFGNFKRIYNIILVPLSSLANEVFDSLKSGFTDFLYDSIYDLLFLFSVDDNTSVCLALDNFEEKCVTLKYSSETTIFDYILRFVILSSFLSILLGKGVFVGSSYDNSALYGKQGSLFK